MTQQGLSPEEYSFSRVFETSKENLSHQTNPVNINLETYFQALFQIEPIPTIFEKTEPNSIPEDIRHHALDDVLGKLSTIEIGGKEHIEEYLRYQYRCHFQANTIMNSYKSLELLLRFMTQRGKARTEEVETPGETKLGICVLSFDPRGTSTHHMKYFFEGNHARISSSALEKGPMRCSKFDTLGCRQTIEKPVNQT